MDYQYKVGMRVGLLARITDVHDKGNIVMLVEGTDLHVQLSEAVLLGGVDLVHAKLQEKATLAQQVAVQPEQVAQSEQVEGAEKAQKPKRERERPASGGESGATQSA